MAEEVYPVGVPARLEQDGAWDESGALRPSLSTSHNSNEAEDSGKISEAFTLNGSQRKTAYALENNVARMFEEAGLERIGFLTLTVGDWKSCAEAGCVCRHEGNAHFVQVFDPAEASRRINSLTTGFLRETFPRAVIVTERHKSGAIHFHLIVECREDIRTGFDFTAFNAKHGYKKSASQALQRLWALFRERLPGYGFGRAELSPICKTGEAISRYVAKYVEKNVLARRPEDKGKKLVRYMGWHGSQMRPNDFCWATPGACEWRTRARSIAALHGITEMHQAREAWGARWAFRLTGVMSDLINSAHLLTDTEFTKTARDWSGDVMIFPDWWRDIEDRHRDEAFGFELEPIDFCIIEEMQAFWDARR
ncbi:hypothetical protein CfE428DRAFT_1410 [Chthoniobacter flavus Ellin428]|uniref:Uncharacterized protein n=1 Tax=Chthoniobacter flavus Ellin428 TaxID=497964 RepID=B4CXW9_9BACT|nr:hypothetical protein [Chthoniobacter flavus]EDY21117.1 hypothetical protein CfE428DRAFT_1410 [Chthoniobacter flavus Ellin428]TCO83612.1 bacteriophage replication gene A protein [Chthoniobacter flavus]